MKICTKCKKEMKCKKTGVIAVWGNGHCYAGDEFECTGCDATILVCCSASFQCQDVRKKMADVISMTKED